MYKNTLCSIQLNLRENYGFILCMLLMTYQIHDASCLLCRRTVQFFITKVENYIKKGKRQMRDHSNSLAFSRESDFRRWYLKEEHVIFIKYTVMRLRYFTARTSFHGSGERNVYTGCNRRNGPNFGRVFLRSNYTDITQNTYIQSSMVTEILAREVLNFDSYYSLIDYQIHIETGRNMWFL